MSCEVGATCTSWDVLADVYQDTTRWDSLAPTPRTIPEDVAGSAPAAVIEPTPTTAATTTTARLPVTASRRRPPFENFLIHLDSFIPHPPFRHLPLAVRAFQQPMSPWVTGR